VFFDLEGDPFVGKRGLECLFGFVYGDVDGAVAYVGDWAINREDEKATFERFIDFVTVRLETWPETSTSVIARRTSRQRQEPHGPLCEP
jgi:hypothetical protein